MAFHSRILHEVQRRLGNYTESAVPADCAEENVRANITTCVHEVTVGQHDLYRAHGAHERAESHVASVRVHGERPANREIGEALHDLDGEIRRVDALLDLAPAHACLHSDRSAHGVEGQNAIEVPHVDLKPSGRCSLAAHAVAAPANRDRTRMPGNCADDLARRRRHEDFADGDGVELRDIRDDRRRYLLLLDGRACLGARKYARHQDKDGGPVTEA